MGTTYNDIKDLLKAIAICKDGQTKAMLHDRLNQVMENGGGKTILNMMFSHIYSVREMFGLAKDAGLKLAPKDGNAGMPTFVHLATTPPPRISTYIYIPEPKSDVLVDTLIANLQGRML